MSQIEDEVEYKPSIRVVGIESSNETEVEIDKSLLAIQSKSAINGPRFVSPQPATAGSIRGLPVSLSTHISMRVMNKNNKIRVQYNSDKLVSFKLINYYVDSP